MNLDVCNSPSVNIKNTKYNELSSNKVFKVLNEIKIHKRTIKNSNFCLVDWLILLGIVDSKWDSSLTIKKIS
jgi:hypothetical protein